MEQGSAWANLAPLPCLRTYEWGYGCARVSGHAQSQLLNNAAQGLRRRCHGPVSYTHLRAHETSAHL
eukprot:11880271-Alexandrium_andersonii.AAC.1